MNNNQIKNWIVNNKKVLWWPFFGLIYSISLITYYFLISTRHDFKVFALPLIVIKLIFAFVLGFGRWAYNYPLAFLVLELMLVFAGYCWNYKTKNGWYSNIIRAVILIIFILFVIYWIWVSIPKTVSITV